MLAGTLWLPVPKPPDFAHASAAGAVARKLTNALIAGVSRKATNRSPAISTPAAPGPGLIDGNVKTLKPVFAFAFVDDRITPATKSASKTIAAFGGVANALVTESLKLNCSAPLDPPATLLVSPTTCAMVLSAAITEGSVHLILCWLSAWYFAGPFERK